MSFKLLSIEFTNETLLNILPFETGYLLREDDEEHTDMPCEYSVQLAMALKSMEYFMNPHRIDLPSKN
jgi:hypothetical protein